MNNRKKMHLAVYAGLGFVLTAASSGIRAMAQTPVRDSKGSPEIYQTLYFTNLTQANDANDLISDLRNMLPNAKLYYVPSRAAISVRGSAEDIALVQKILADLDKTKRIYRLTYTMTEKDGGKTVGSQRYAVIVASGSRTDLKQGSRVPIATGGKNASGDTEVQYLDIGEEIDATLDGYLDGVRLRTKVVQSNIVEEKSGVGTSDPVIRQTTLEGTSTLVEGKPLVLGSLDFPGSTRHEEVEVVSELVR